MKKRRQLPGRPAFEATPAILDAFERAGALGLNLTQSCLYAGIGYSTFAAHRDEYREIGEAWERGRQKTAAEVATALRVNALTGTEQSPGGNVAAQRILLRQVGDWRDKVEASGPADEDGSAPPLQVVITLPDNGRHVRDARKA